MDGHLTALQATLASINGLHERQRQKRNYQPFTAAILNTHHLEVEDYIRDADQLENNLFWYPSPPGARLNEPRGGRKEDERASLQQQDSEGGPSLVTPRLPEPREFVPPTPLKKQAKEAEAKGLVTFDARTLLKAAQKLLDNYHNAPRARKHIKTLLKRHAEVQRAVAQHKSSLAESEALIAKLSSPSEAQATVAELQRTAKAASAGNQQDDRDGFQARENKRLQEQLKVEEMEIFALEQQREELAERRQRLEAKKKAGAKTKAGNGPRAAVASTRDEVGQQSPATANVGDETIAAPATASASAPQRIEESKTATETEGDEGGDGDETIRLDPSRVPRGNDGDDDDEDNDLMQQGGDDVLDAPAASAQRPPAETPDAKAGATSAATTAATMTAPLHEKIDAGPQSTEELERITANIWKSFGSYLRFAAPDCESADFLDTLAVLDDVSLCRSRAAAGGRATAAGDESIASSAVTDATSGSSASTEAARLSNLYDAGPPTAVTAISAHVLGTLLRSSEPHEKPVEEIKADGKRWWDETGRSAYERSGLAAAGSQEHKDQGDDLAFKAVFSLHGKKVVRIKYQGNTRIVTMKTSP